MNTPYKISTDVRFSPLELIDVKRMERETKDQWVNQTLCRVNDCVVRLGVLHGEYHWHKHDHEDEFFYVVSGQLLVDLEERSIDLTPGKGVVIPKGTMHRPRAPERTVMLMVERKGIVPTGTQRS